MRLLSETWSGPVSGTVSRVWDENLWVREGGIGTAVSSAANIPVAEEIENIAQQLEDPEEESQDCTPQRRLEIAAEMSQLNQELQKLKSEAGLHAANESFGGFTGIAGLVLVTGAAACGSLFFGS